MIGFIMIKDTFRFIFIFLLSLASRNGRVRISTETVVLCHSFGKGKAPCKRFLDIFAKYENNPFTYVYLDRRSLLQIPWKQQETPLVPRVYRLDYQVKFFLYHYRRALKITAEKRIGYGSLFNTFISPHAMNTSLILFFFDCMLDAPKLSSVVTPVERLEWEEGLNLWLLNKQVRHIGVAYTDYRNRGNFWQRKLIFDAVLVGSKSAKILATEYLHFRDIQVFSDSPNTCISNNEPIKSVIFALQTDWEEISEVATLLDTHLIEDNRQKFDVIISVHPAIRMANFLLLRLRLAHRNRIKVELGLSEKSIRNSQFLFFTKSTSWSMCYGTNCVPIQLLRFGDSSYPKMSTLNYSKLPKLIEQSFKRECLLDQFSNYVKNHGDLYWN